MGEIAITERRIKNLSSREMIPHDLHRPRDDPPISAQMRRSRIKERLAGPAYLVHCECHPHRQTLSIADRMSGYHIRRRLQPYSSPRARIDSLRSGRTTSNITADRCTVHSKRDGPCRQLPKTRDSHSVPQSWYPLDSRPITTVFCTRLDHSRRRGQIDRVRCLRWRPRPPRIKVRVEVRHRPCCPRTINYWTRYPRLQGCKAFWKERFPVYPDSTRPRAVLSQNPQESRLNRCLLLQKPRCWSAIFSTIPTHLCLYSVRRGCGQRLDRCTTTSAMG